MKCPYCGSERIEEGIKWSQEFEVGNVGLEYKLGIIRCGTSQVYSDLCLKCGTIIRTYIKDNTNKEWIKE